jgi:hypothetical protein
MDAGETVDGGGVDYPVYEYDNGSMKLVLRFLYGSNSARQEANTYLVLSRILNLLGSHGFEVRVTTSKENFSESVEAREHVAALNRSTDKVLAKTMMDITQAVFDESARTSNVDVLYVTARTKFNYQKLVLGDVVRDIFILLKENRTGFRSVEALYKKYVLEHYKDFYGLEAIDLSLMKVRDIVESEEGIAKLVEVYQLIDSEGRTYTKSDILDSRIRIARRIR